MWPRGSARFVCPVSQASSRHAHMQLMSRPCNDNVNECHSMYVRCFVTTVCTNCTNCTCMASHWPPCTVTRSRSFCEHTASDVPHLTMCHLVTLITIRSTVGFTFCIYTHPAPCPDRVTVRASVSHPRTPAPRVTGLTPTHACPTGHWSHTHARLPHGSLVRAWGRRAVAVCRPNDWTSSTQTVWMSS
jgi:hypothetical protein